MVTLQGMSKHLESFRELQADLVKAQKEVANAQKRVDTLLPLVRAYEAFLQAQGQQISAVVTTLPLADASAKPDYKAVARSILAGAPRPLTVNEILDRFEAIGKPVTTTDPYRTVFKLLSRHDDVFENIGGGKWRAKLAA